MLRVAQGLEFGAILALAWPGGSLFRMLREARGRQASTAAYRSAMGHAPLSFLPFLRETPRLALLAESGGDPIESPPGLVKNPSWYIQGDRCSLVAFAVLVLITCCAGVLTLLILFRVLPSWEDAITASVVRSQSSTPSSYRDCPGGRPYTGSWSSEVDEMLFEAFLCSDGTLIAIFHDQDIPEFITINERPPNSLEFSWAVSVDVDADRTTGTPPGYFRGYAGADYELSLAHWSRGEEERVPFANAFQVNVWRFSDEGAASSISAAKHHIDVENRRLVLRGSIPQMSPDSRVLFSKFYYSTYSLFNYRTEWIVSGQ